MPRTAEPTFIDSPAAGIIQDMPPHLINPRGWSDGLNVRFFRGRVETSPGWEKFTSQNLSSPVKHLSHYFKINNTDFAIAITNASVWYFDTASDLWVDITGGTPLTGITDDFVMSDTAFDLFIFTNNVDRIKRWNGTGNIANLGGLTTAVITGGTTDVQTAKGLTSFAGFLHLAATIEDGTRQSQRWRWSRFGNAESWDNTGTYGQAGYADLTDGPDKLQTVKRLGGDFVALYKENSIHIAQYVGPPTVWSRRLVVDGIGLMAPGAVASIINEHIFLANDNFYVFNGISIKPIGDAIFDTFILELNPEKSHLVWAHTIYEKHEVIFGYPSGGSEVPNKAVVLNYKTGAWSFRDMPFLTMGPYRRSDSADSWNSDSEAWDDDDTRWDDASFSANAPQHLAGANDGYIHDYGMGYSQDGSAHNSYVISPGINSGRPDLIKRWLRIYADLIASGPHNLEISYSAVNSPNATLTWSSALNLLCDLSQDGWVPIDTAGRYIYLRFRTNGTNDPFKLTGYGHDSRYRGPY